MDRKYLYFISAAHFINDISTGALPAMLPFFVVNYGMDYRQAAGIMFASSFLGSIVQPLFGWLADRRPRSWFMGVGVLLSGMGFALTGVFTDYWSIFVATAIMGVGSAVFHPEAARLVNLISGKRRGQSMSIFSVGGNGGFGSGPLLAVALIGIFGMKGLLCYGVLGFVTCMLLLVWVPHLQHLAAKNSADAFSEAECQSKTKFASRTKTQTNDGEIASFRGNKAENDWSAFRRLTVFIILRSVEMTGISSFLPLFCIKELGASTAEGSMMLSAISLLGIAGTLIGGYLADRLGYLRVLCLSSWVLVPVVALLVYAPKLAMVYILLLPLAVVQQMQYSPLVVLGQTYLSQSVGLASGVTLGLAFSIGGTIAPLLGWYGDRNGIAGVMFILVLVMIAEALSTLFLPKPKES